MERERKRRKKGKEKTNDRRGKKTTEKQGKPADQARQDRDPKVVEFHYRSPALA